MKHQLIELLKKANEGISATPSVVKELVQQYQMAAIAFLILGIIFFVVGIVLIFSTAIGVTKHAEWASIEYLRESESMWEWTALSCWVLCFGILGTVLGFIAIVFELGPALAPAWYMINSLMS